MIDINFEGNKFYPSKLKELSGLPLEISAEYGVIATKGRYKDESSPYGLAHLKVELKNNCSIEDTLNEYLVLLTKMKNTLDDCGVESICVFIGMSKDSYRKEFRLNIPILKDLVFLNASIEFY